MQITMKKGLGLNTLMHNAALTLGRQLAAGFLQLVTVVALARALGPSGNGRYAVAMLLPAMLVTLFNMGIAPANVYYLGSRKVNLSTVFKTVSRLTVAIAILGGIIGSVSILFFREFLFPNVPIAVLWLALFIFPFTLYHSYLTSIFQGLQRFHEFNLIILVQPLVTLLLVLIFISIGSANVKNMLIACLFGFAAAIIMALSIINKSVEPTRPHRPLRRYISSAISYGIKAHLSNVLAFMNYKLDIFLLNLFLGPSVTGVYVVAVQLVERLWILSQSLGTVILPRLAQLSEDEDTRKRLTPMICRMVIATTFAGAIICAFAAPPFVRILFGKAYRQAVPAIMWLLPGIVAGAGARILANDIAARGRPELNMYFAIVVLAINLAGNILLIPNFGLIGATVATSIAYIGNLILQLIVFQRISGNHIRHCILVRYSDIVEIKNSFNITR